MRRTTFTIIIVCLNAGKKLKDTFESVRKQTFCDYEVLIKDGGSTDGSVDRILREEEELAHSPMAPCLRVIKRKDRGIYDAMNQAVKEAEGEYILFLNCGDKLADGQVLKKTGDIIKKVDHIMNYPENISSLFITAIFTVRKPAHLWRRRGKLQVLPVTGIFPATRRAFTTGACLKTADLRRIIGFGRITTTFCGAFTGKERPLCIVVLRSHPMKAAVIRRVKRIGKGIRKSTDSLRRPI